MHDSTSVLQYILPEKNIMNQPSKQINPTIAVFDMNITAKSPAGSCVLAEINGLADFYRIVAVAGELRNDHPECIDWLKVPLPRGPVLLRYLVFHTLGPIAYALWWLRGGRADIVQATQGQFPPADIAYAHFCHRAYLNNQWRTSTVTGPRRWARWLSHQFNAFFEAKAFARCRVLVVPSLGLARELAQEYPNVSDKIEVISNPVALDRFTRPTDFDREAQRKKLGFNEHDLVLSFMALGDFSRKGLGLLIEALGKLEKSERNGLKLLVIGGKSGEIDMFRTHALQHGVDAHLVFVGMQQEVAPYLWVSDVFAFPSAYEIFSLAILQAAASGLPVMVSQGLYGAEEMVVNEVNGWQVARNALSIHQWLLQLLGERAKLEAMSYAAAESVRQYSVEAFNARWQTLYERLLSV